MATFRLLGTIELTAADGMPLGEIVRGPKRVALLAYLALATPRGAHRRDTLVALLWPELDQERARAALRHTLYHLRRALGPDAFVAVGDEAIGLAPGALDCDAARASDLLDAGRDEEALALYRGELLGGFFLSGAVEFERWLDGERARLRTGAANAAWRLSEAREHEGDREAAVRWARRATAILADDEAAVRRLLEVLDRTGNRAAALREYEGFVRRLEAELGVEPDAETKALAARLRQPGGGTRQRYRPEPTRESAGETDHADGGATSPALSSAGAPTGGSRRWLRGAALGVAAAAALAVIAWFATRSRLDEPLDGRAVAVLPFEVRGDASVGYLGQGMVDLLSLKIDGVAGYRSVDTRTLMRETGGRPARDDEAARAIARRLRARLYVAGSVVGAGDRVQLVATLYDADGGVRATAQTAPAPASRVFELVDDLARQLLVGEMGAGSGIVRLASTTTASFPALRAYLNGEQALREGRPQVALDAFRQAIAEDSTFALAHYRLGFAATWATDTVLARTANARALQLGDRLPAYARRLLLAADAWRGSRYAEAESLYRVAAASRPDDVDAWFALGDLYYHHNATRGRSRGEARDPFVHALRLDPGHGESRAHLLELATYDGSLREVDSLLTALPSRNDFAGKWPLVRALLANDTAAESRVFEEARRMEDRQLVRLVIHAVAAFPSNPAGGERLLGLLTEPTRAPGWRAYGHYLRAHLELTRGRWGAAREELTALGSMEPAAGTEYGAYFAASPWLRLPRREVLATREALERWDAEPTPPASSRPFSGHDKVHPELRSYLIGLLSAKLGDTAAVLRQAQVLETRVPSSASQPVARALARALRARVVLARGRPADALAELGEPWLELTGRHTSQSAILGMVAERYLRAELLAATGREGEALRAFAAVADYSLDGLPYLAPSLLARAKIHERAGDEAAAARAYARVLDLWRDADPPLHPLRDAAARRLATLR